MILVSCEAQPTQPKQNQEEKELIAEDQIMHFIIEDYKKQYKELQLKEIDDEGWHELTFYEKSNPTTDYELTLSHVRIPNYTLEDELENNPIKGDINNDNIKDYLVKVLDEGGGGGGNITLITYYLFTSVDGKYECSSIKSSGELSGCDKDYGFFIADQMENQQIIGEAQCYAENDGRCCPSLHYKTIVTLQDGELKHFSNVAVSPEKLKHLE